MNGNLEQYLQQLEQHGITYRRYMELRWHCSWQIGGYAQAVVLPEDMQQCQKAMELANRCQIDPVILGSGSNVLIADEGVDVVLKMDNMQKIEDRGDTMFVQAGVPLPYLALRYALANKADLIFASGIPGSVGGAVVMNAGAYGEEFSKVVKRVYCSNRKGERVVFEPQDCQFSYRNSIFKQNKEYLVMAVEMAAVEEMPYETVSQRIKEYKLARAKKQPLDYPNAGSVFCNPPNDSAGRLVEQAGLKGKKQGGAQISEKHGNFIVNVDHASAKDVLALMDEIQRTVKEQTGVLLKPEVQLIGIQQPIQDGGAK